jgi:hypothetical protein
MIIALLIVLAATIVAHFCTARPLKPIRAAGARLVSDIKAMVEACDALGKVNSEAATSCGALSRGLAAATTNAAPSVEESRRLYLGLASTTSISSAASAYALAAGSETNSVTAPLLQNCSGRLRQIVKSIHRLGAALELE